MQAVTGTAQGHGQLVPAQDATASSGGGGDSAYDATSLRDGMWWEGTRDGAVLLLHDLGVTPEGLATPALSMYYEGFWTAAPLLPGHETIATTGRLSDLDLAEILATVDRWVAALQAATLPLVVVGFGLGASLAVLVATTYRVRGLVTVNMAVRSYRRRRLRSRLAALATGRALSLDIDAKREDVDEAQAEFLDSDAFAVARDLERIGAAELASVNVPTLMFQSRHDHVVAPADATTALSRLGTASRELVWLERSFHQAWLDYDAPFVAERSAAFVRAVCDRPALPAPPPSSTTAEMAAVAPESIAVPDGFGTGEWPALTPEQPVHGSGRGEGGDGASS